MSPTDADARFAALAKLFTAERGVTFGKMMAAAGLKVHGRIFAMLWRGRLVVKLPRDRVYALEKAGRGERFDPGHGRKMKEWVVVGAGKADWTALVREAYRFVKEARDK